MRKTSIEQLREGRGIIVGLIQGTETPRRLKNILREVRNCVGSLSHPLRCIEFSPQETRVLKEIFPQIKLTEGIIVVKNMNLMNFFSGDCSVDQVCEAFKAAASDMRMAPQARPDGIAATA